MDSETIDTVTGWRSEPYSGGYDGLHELADREFTGAVTDGTAWLFVLNGRFVGVSDGTVESFEDADGTAYAAPDPSLPLLFAMRERGGETKAKYYTNDTPLSEADRTLSAGNFTGFVELSENVLSGDYYVVYHGGRRLACAFVGTRRETLTGDEAFERADDEVGIYEVRTVDVDVIDVPEPEPEPEPTESVAAGADEPSETGAVPDAGGAGAGAAGVGTTAATVDAAESGEDAEGSVGSTGEDPRNEGPAADQPDVADPGSVTIESDPSPAVEESADDGSAEGPAPEPGEDDADRPDAESRTTGAEAVDASTDEPSDAAAGTSAVESPSGEAAGADATDADGSEAGGPPPAAPGESPPRYREQTREEKLRRDAEPTDAVAASESDPFSAEEQWRETRSIPSLDPDETGVSVPSGAEGTASSDAVAGSAAARPRPRSEADDERQEGPDAASADEPSNAVGESASESSAQSPPESAEGSDAAGTAELRRDLQRARSAHEEVAGELAATREELTEAHATVERLREENERLEGRVETLQSELADARTRLSEADGDAAPEGRTVQPERALSGTNLFVRYDSKGAGTLEKAHAGHASREEVDENLRMEVHTEFDDDYAVVDGRPYEEWLRDTIEYGFVAWVVRTLLYEIQDTGNVSAMRDLYEAIPKIDRAELDGVVDLVDEQGKKSEERTFDVVLRDRMGDPLFVANVTDSREATNESMLDGLVEGSSQVADQYDGLAAAFHVTASFFEPGALEAVADATGGGLLSRGKQKSFVKMSRKRGFHLCLVESRDGEFHVNVPEL
ncbi:hypothetical protein HUG10_08180 [Halorarum halophilum]|uniref:DUF7527 domain-containing protein n=1 Tax=Halorarum halophilum TaxID=2743090 RepID=A0A7D5GHG5_9EURY|nr:hypothetical protein [Halobaculum halophilum]QLG27531.1 hypothetical protein HUG10_08180 [Halobaculum halophilum]